MKTNPCKLCQSTFHTKSCCPENSEAVAKSKATKERMAEKARERFAKGGIVKGNKLVTEGGIDCVYPASILKPSKSVKPAKGKSTKKKAESRSQIVKKLDTVFSQYVRLSQSDSDGFGECITCGVRLFWKEAQACHFYTRGRYPTRWDEDNVKFGCYRCNVLLKGNYINYTKYMLDSYSREFIDELEYKSLNGEKTSTPDLREKIAYYKTEVEKLKSQKGIE